MCKQIQHEAVGDTGFSSGMVGRGELWSCGEAQSEEAGCGKAFCLNNQTVTASNLGLGQ